MMRRRHSTGLIRPQNSSKAQEDVDPNSSLVNLADCMLVMVVGLLIALVTHYGVDLVNADRQLTGTEVIMDSDEDGVVDEGYVKAGTVYKDKETGKYYMTKK